MQGALIKNLVVILLKNENESAQPIHQAGRAKAHPLCQTLGFYKYQKQKSQANAWLFK